MPLIFKIDVLEALKAKGYTTYSLREFFSNTTIQKFRTKEPISWKNIETICKLLECQPGDIIEYVEE